MADTKKSSGQKSDAPARDKSTSPSRDKRGGGTPSDEALPKRENRKGPRRYHDRDLTPAERDKRTKQRADARKASVDAQKKERAERQPKGWAGRRAGRSRSR